MGAGPRSQTNPLQVNEWSERSRCGRSKFIHQPHICLLAECRYRAASFPSEIMFQVEMLPETLSLPTSKMSARLTGGLLNFVHLCVCISRIRKVPESITGWEEMYMETEEQSWFDWVRSIALYSSSLGSPMIIDVPSRHSQRRSS